MSHHMVAATCKCRWTNTKMPFVITAHSKQHVFWFNSELVYTQDNCFDIRVYI